MTTMNLVLLPGFMLDAGLWKDVEPLLGNQHAVVHGDLTQHDTIEGMAAGILAQSSHSFVLVGFSMGGYVAREVARMAPDRVHGPILIATSARADTAEDGDRKARSVERVATQGHLGLSRSLVMATLHRSDNPTIPSSTASVTWRTDLAVTSLFAKPPTRAEAISIA